MLFRSDTFTGPVNITSGTFLAGSISALGNVLNPVTLANTVGVTLDLNGNSVVIGSLSGGGTTGGTVSLGAAALTVGGNNENTTFGGAITGAGGVLSKNGTGILTLAGTNTYDSGTLINAGLININSSAALGAAAGAVSIAAGAGLQWAANNTNNAYDITAHTVTLGNGNVIFDTNGNVVAFANPIGEAGTGNLVKNGFGTLILQAANNYSGTTTVNQGVLNLRDAGALGVTASGVTVNVNGALTLQGGLNFGTKPLTLNGSGAVTGQAGALVNVSGANTYAGVITLGSSATIAVDAGTLTLNSGTAVGGTGTLTLAGAGSGTLADNLNQIGGLNKTGTGAWTLTGASSSFTGPLSLTGGTLNFVSGALGTGTNNVTLGGGVLDLSSGSQSINNLTISAGTNNFVTLGAGATLVAGGTLTRGTGGLVSFDLSAASPIVKIVGGVGSGPNNILG